MIIEIDGIELSECTETSETTFSELTDGALWNLQEKQTGAGGSMRPSLYKLERDHEAISQPIFKKHEKGSSLLKSLLCISIFAATVLVAIGVYLFMQSISNNIGGIALIVVPFCILSCLIIIIWKNLQPTQSTIQPSILEGVLSGLKTGSSKPKTQNATEESKLQDMLQDILGTRDPVVTTLDEMISAIEKILDFLPWDPDDVDERIVQLVLRVMKEMKIDADFFMMLATKMGTKDWMYNDKFGYGKSFIWSDPRIKVGVYKWDGHCIAPIHDHGNRTVAFYAALGSQSHIMNKVYRKLGDANNGVEKIHDEILGCASGENTVSVLRVHHAHAIQNLSSLPGYTLHVYIPSYDFGLMWEYEQRKSVMTIRQSLMQAYE